MNRRRRTRREQARDFSLSFERPFKMHHHTFSTHLMQNDLEVSQKELIEIARVASEKLMNFLSTIGSREENYPGRFSILLDQVNHLFETQEWASVSNGGHNKFIHRLTDITIEYSNNQDPLDSAAVVIIAKRIQDHVNLLHQNILEHSPQIRHQANRDSLTGLFSINEQRERRDFETGWQDLHKKIIDYRQNNQITIVRFIELCGLPNKSYFRQLCCLPGNDLHPSNKPGSTGKMFLDAVAILFHKIQNGSLTPFVVEKDLENELYDFQMDHIQVLHRLNICGMNHKRAENKIIVKCLSNAVEEEIKLFLKEKFFLKDDIEIELLEYESL
jgi:hypothetical protein